MPLFRRISNLLSANLNNWVERYEDPEKMLRQAIREMEQAVHRAMDRVATAIANEKRLARQLHEHRQQADRCQERALQAIAGDNDADARKALRLRLHHQDLAEALSNQHTSAEETGRQLRRQISALQAKLAETKRRLAVTAARTRVAEARQKLHSVASGDAFSKVDRWMERLQLAEAHAEAWCELTTGMIGDVNEEDITESMRIEQELALLKEREHDGVR